MPNTSVRAAAEGLPALNRRRLLLGLAAASTAAAVVTVAPAAQAATPAENPELLRLADELPASEAAYQAARAAQNTIRDLYGPQWPLAPDEISRALPWAPYHSMERSLFGGALARKGEEHPRELTTSEYIARRIEDTRDDLSRENSRAKPRTKHMARLEADLDRNLRLIPIAEAYEAECDRLRKAADYDAAWRRTKDAVLALAAHVGKVMEQPDRTIEGIFVKAEALAAWGRVYGPDQGWACFDGNRWCAQIATSLLRYSNGDVS